MQYLILTGMSGAGKTVAIRYLEDLGALCVDNLPPMMLVPFMEACQNTNLHKPMIAIAADVRSGEFFDAKAVTRMIDEARLVGFHIDTLFFEASDEVLDQPLQGDPPGASPERRGPFAGRSHPGGAQPSAAPEGSGEPSV